jgi:Golgi nucleoside diphosphatase
MQTGLNVKSSVQLRLSHPVCGAGGMRQLPTHQREAIIAQVRMYLSNRTTCPFYFEHDFARVISGEEEGIYGWTAINFLLGGWAPKASHEPPESSQAALRLDLSTK